MDSFQAGLRRLRFLTRAVQHAILEAGLDPTVDLIFPPEQDEEENTEGAPSPILPGAADASPSMAPGVPPAPANALTALQEGATDTEFASMPVSRIGSRNASARGTPARPRRTNAGKRSVLHASPFLLVSEVIGKLAAEVGDPTQPPLPPPLALDGVDVTAHGEEGHIFVMPQCSRSGRSIVKRTYYGDEEASRSRRVAAPVPVLPPEVPRASILGQGAHHQLAPTSPSHVNFLHFVDTAQQLSPKSECGPWSEHVPNYRQPTPAVMLGSYLAFFPNGRPGDMQYRPPAYNQGRRASATYDSNYRPRVMVDVLAYKKDGNKYLIQRTGGDPWGPAGGVAGPDEEWADWVTVHVERFDVLDSFVLPTQHDMREQHAQYHLGLHMQHKYEHNDYVKRTGQDWGHRPPSKIDMKEAASAAKLSHPLAYYKPTEYVPKPPVYPRNWVLRDGIEAATGEGTSAQATAQAQHGKGRPATISTPTKQATTPRKAGPSKGGKTTPAGKGRRLPKTNLFTAPQPTAPTAPRAPPVSLPAPATTPVASTAQTPPHVPNEPLRQQVDDQPIAAQHGILPSMIMGAPQPPSLPSGPTAQEHMVGTHDNAPAASAMEGVFTLGASGHGKAKAPSDTPPLPTAFSTSKLRRPTKNAFQSKKTANHKPTTAGGLPAPTASSATAWHFNPNAMREKLATRALGKRTARPDTPTHGPKEMQGPTHAVSAAGQTSAHSYGTRATFTAPAIPDGGDVEPWRRKRGRHAPSSTPQRQAAQDKALQDALQAEASGDETAAKMAVSMTDSEEDGMDVQSDPEGTYTVGKADRKVKGHKHAKRGGARKGLKRG